MKTYWGGSGASRQCRRILGPDGDVEASTA